VAKTQAAAAFEERENATVIVNALAACLKLGGCVARRYGRNRPAKLAGYRLSTLARSLKKLSVIGVNVSNNQRSGWLVAQRRTKSYGLKGWRQPYKCNQRKSAVREEKLSSHAGKLILALITKAED